MARSPAHLENNSFVKGLITEASPLTFPENASLDEANFDLRIDGTRDRRLGIDYEPDYQIITTTQQSPASGDIAFNTFLWEDVSGDATLSITVVQTGAEIRMFETIDGGVSSAEVGTPFSLGTGSATYGLSSVNGRLVIADGTGDITSISYEGGAFIQTTHRLLVRDLWGVEDITPEGVDLFSPDGLGVRPIGDGIATHHYNLENQSWGPFQYTGRWNDDTVSPITTFRAFAENPLNTGVVEPANSDVVHIGVIVDPTDDVDPPREKFFTHLMTDKVNTYTPAPKGFFIIDALRRGAARTVQAGKKGALNETYELPIDRTDGGASVVAEFAGRVFYSGFGSSGEDLDNRSPSLSSYVMFSQLVKHNAQVGLCYQEGDPTDVDSPELIATDGGYIKIQGAFGINQLVNIGNALVVLATNGTWLIRGESGVGFSATAYEVVKLTERGCISSNSVAVVGDGAVYWASDGIYSITRNAAGEYEAENVTHTTIRKLYDGIPIEVKRKATGVFDSYQRKVVWMYGGESGSTSHLILDTTLGAFYPRTFTTDSTGYPRTVGAIEVLPFKEGVVVDEVVVGGDPVVAGVEDVRVSSSIREGLSREVKYLTLTSPDPITGAVRYTFSAFTNQEFKDWYTFDGVGSDAHAYLLTGHLTGGDSSRYKYVPTIFFHFKRTEDGFQDIGGETVATQPSSCIVQAQWDWANDPSSGRWGREFQAYRYSRHYMPQSITDDYDYGLETIVTRNKLRGKGRALSLLIKSEPEKDLRLVGWGQETLVNRRA